jgi:hypothetical protein
MRCDEVIRELAAPSECRDEPGLAHHLSECKNCADWADRAGRLDRLWEATRPADPPQEAWDSIWSSVRANLDRADRPVEVRPWALQTSRSINDGTSRLPSTFTRSGRGLAVAAAIVLAQAAAIFLAVHLAWIGPVDRGNSNAVQVVDVDEGQVAYIRSVGPTVAVLDVTADELPDGEDTWYVFFNRVESSVPVVAMTE